MTGRPVAWTPNVPALMPSPTAGQPRAVRRWRGSRGTDLKRRRRLGQVVYFLHRGVGPVSGSPLIALRGLAPVPGDPLAAGRQGAPYPADPQEVVALVVPCPIARDPGNVVSFRLLIRRQFLDVGGRILWCHDARLGLESYRFRKRLVYRPAGEHVHPLLGIRLVSRSCNRIRQTNVGAKSDQGCDQAPFQDVAHAHDCLLCRD